MKTSILLMIALLAGSATPTAADVHSYNVVETRLIAQNYDNDDESPAYMTAEEDAETNEVSDESSDLDFSTSTSRSSDDWRSQLLFILALVAVVWALGHMLYTLLIKERKIAQITVGLMKSERNALGMSEESAEEENQQCASLMNEIYDSYYKFTAEDGSERGMPTKHNAMVLTKDNLSKVLALKSTDNDVVEAYNNYAEIYNDAQERIFAGSKVLIVVAILLAAFMSFMASSVSPLVTFAISIALYWLSVMKPSFMFYKNEINGKSHGVGLMNAILGGVFGTVAAAKTYKTVTKWSDGTTTTDTDNSETVFALVFAIIVCVILVAIMSLVALINYLRNYVFYK